MNVNNVRIVQRCYDLSLPDKLLLETVYLIHRPPRKDTHFGCSRIAVAILPHEEFLNGHFSVQAALQAQVSNAKTTLGQHLIYSVFTSLKEGSRL